MDPGNSVGQLTVGAGTSTWAGATYLFEYASTTPGANGVTHDHVNAAGPLNFTATAASPFAIDIRASGFFPPPGGPPVTFTFASFTTVTGFNPATDQNKFVFPVTGFFQGTPTVGLTGGNITLTFVPAPEPVHLLLLCGAAAGGVRWWRRRVAA